MTVVLTSTLALTIAPSAQLCVPDAAIGCHQDWLKSPMVGAGSVWTATFTPLSGTLELPLYGVLRVRAQGVGEIIRWFRVLGGVGPAHEHADAPTADGLLMVDTSHELSRPHECNRVFVSPAASAEALDVSLSSQGALTPPIGFVGLPLDIDILLPADDGTCVSTGVGGPTLPVTVTLTLFYSQDVIDRYKLNEASLSILHFDRGPDAWVERKPLDRDPYLNWVSVKVDRDGIYGIVWVVP
jgi:hypothetical protein